MRTADWLQDKSNLLIMELETFYDLTTIHWATRGPRIWLNGVVGCRRVYPGVVTSDSVALMSTSLSPVWVGPSRSTEGLRRIKGRGRKDSLSLPDCLQAGTSFSAAFGFRLRLALCRRLSGSQHPPSWEPIPYNKPLRIYVLFCHVPLENPDQHTPSKFWEVFLALLAQALVVTDCKKQWLCRLFQPLGHPSLPDQVKPSSLVYSCAQSYRK